MPSWCAPSPLPNPVLTPRLEVRPYTSADAPALFDAVARDRQALLPWLPWAGFAHQNEQETAEFLRDCQARAASSEAPDFTMGVFLRTDGTLVGGTGLHAIRPAVGEAEIGYWITASHRRRGLCVEATAALISAALTPAAEGGWGLRRIVISCAALNVGSVGVCTRLGLRREAVRRGDRWFEGHGSQPPGYIDSHTYAVLADEWDTTAHRRLE